MGGAAAATAVAKPMTAVTMAATTVLTAGLHRVANITYSYRSTPARRIARSATLRTPTWRPARRWPARRPRSDRARRSLLRGRRHHQRRDRQPQRQGAGLRRGLRARPRRYRRIARQARTGGRPRPRAPRPAAIPGPPRLPATGGLHQARRLPRHLRRRPPTQAGAHHVALPAPRSTRDARRALRPTRLENHPVLVPRAHTRPRHRQRRPARHGRAHPPRETVTVKGASHVVMISPPQGHDGPDRQRRAVTQVGRGGAAR